MKITNGKKLSALLITLTLFGTAFAKPKVVIPVPVPVPVPVKPQPVPVKPQPAPPPPPPPKVKVHPDPHSHHHVRMEGRIRIRRHRGEEIVVLEARSGDFILYPDDTIRHPLSYRDLYKYEGEYVELEGFEGFYPDEIYVTDIWRAPTRIKEKPNSPPPPKPNSGPIRESIR